MTCQFYPCRKCQINILYNADCICCDICNKWLHVNCSGLTFKIFKIMCKDVTQSWYCKLCIKDIFPFGKLGDILYDDMINENCKNNNKNEMKLYIEKNNFESTCSICSKKCRNYGAIPCSVCKHLVHKKCSKLRDKISKLNTLMNWTCHVCLNNLFPFQNITNHILKEQNTTQITDLKLDISYMKDEYNFLHILNETEENDIKELHKIKLTLTQKMFSVFYTNISSLKANFDNLHTLLAQMPMTFDIISQKRFKYISGLDL